MLAAFGLTLLAASTLGLLADPAGLMAGIQLPYFDPAIPIPGLPVFHWYGAMYVVGFAIGYVLLQYLRERNLNPVGKEQLLELTFWLIVFVAIGGKVGYWVLYYKDGLVQQQLQIKSLGDACSALFGGGRSFHAAAFACLLACAWIGWRWRLSPLWLTDLTCVVAAPGLFFGRIGNFINQELWGRPASESLPWAMKFYSEAIKVSQKPFGETMAQALAATTQPAASAASAPATWQVKVPAVPAEVWTRFIELQSGVLNPGLEDAERMGIGMKLRNLLAANEPLRPVMEWVQQQQISYAQPFLEQVPYRHPSQLYQALGEGVLLFIILWALRAKLGERKGFISGVFLVGYGAIRFVQEFFREADRLGPGDTPYYWQGLLSLGQIYCLVMVAAGLVVLAWARRAGTLTEWDRRRVAWAATGDEESPPVEAYAPGQAPKRAKPLATKLAIYQKAYDTRCLVNDDGTTGAKLKGKELRALERVLPRLRALQSAWGPPPESGHG